MRRCLVGVRPVHQARMAVKAYRSYARDLTYAPNWSSSSGPMMPCHAGIWPPGQP
jgi:hypothetical protein